MSALAGPCALRAVGAKFHFGGVMPGIGHLPLDSEPLASTVEIGRTMATRQLTYRAILRELKLTVKDPISCLSASLADRGIHRRRRLAQKVGKLCKRHSAPSSTHILPRIILSLYTMTCKMFRYF